MTDELKKQRKIRGGHRGHVKKLLSQAERLSQHKIILREKLDTLKALDGKILELIDDDGGIEATERSYRIQ